MKTSNVNLNALLKFLEEALKDLQKKDLESLEVNLKQAYGRVKNLKTEAEDHDKLVEDKHNIEKIIKNCEDYFKGVLGHRDPEIDRKMRKDCAEERAKLAEINKQLGET